MIVHHFSIRNHGNHILIVPLKFLIISFFFRLLDKDTREVCSKRVVGREDKYQGKAHTL